MAAFDCVRDMNDMALKPRHLRSLLRDSLPDEKRPFRDPSVLPGIISKVRTHRLLSEESLADSADKKLVDDWRSAVSAWVKRVLMLASSESQSKCWAGVSLLGLTCQECSSKRFLESYPAWIEILKAHIEPSTVSHMVKVASCASLGDLLLRLGHYPISHEKGGFAERVVQLSLELLNENNSETVWTEVVHLIGIMVEFFPSALRRHYDNVEACIISKIFSGKCSNFILEKLACCLALLPKAKGDEGTWCLLMQKILLFVNDYLKDAFEGLEAESRSHESSRLLVPPGKSPPLPLAYNKAKTWNLSKQTCFVVTMMLCCSEMLKNSYPAQVSVPMQLLLLLVERMLNMDGSILKTSSSFVVAVQQELLCSELPRLHSSALDLLIALTKGMRSQMLPRSPYVVQIITRYLSRCVVPELRVKVYSVIRMLIISMGAGMAKKLDEKLMMNLLVDCHPHQEKKVIPSNLQFHVTKTSGEQPKNKKRKKPSTAEPPQQEDHSDLGEYSMESSRGHHELKIAALATLEAFFTMGGALQSDGSEVDDLIISLALSSFDNLRASSEEMLLAALRALLASILSQVHQRPPCLANTLELFRRGRRLAGSKVSEFCAHSMPALEAIIHPRALPLSDYNAPPSDPISAGFNHNSFGMLESSYHTHGVREPCPDPNDDIKGAHLLVDELKSTLPLEESPHAKPSGEYQKESLSNGSLNENALRSKETRPPVAVANDETMLDSVNPQPPTTESRELSSPNPVAILPTRVAAKEVKDDTRDDEGSGFNENRVLDEASDSDTVLLGGGDTGYENLKLDKSKEFAQVSEDDKDLRQDSDNESDSYGFPDIVFDDPDSDSDEVDL